MDRIIVEKLRAYRFLHTLLYGAGEIKPYIFNDGFVAPNAGLDGFCFGLVEMERWKHDHQSQINHFVKYLTTLFQECGFYPCDLTQQYIDKINSFCYNDIKDACFSLRKMALIELNKLI